MSFLQSTDTTAQDVDEQTPQKPMRTPLPKFQLFIVLLIQFSEPITATIIYPFVDESVRKTCITGGDERKTGYYAGIIESSFFAAALTVFHWGRASDKYGRRPILLFGPLGLSLAVLSFGLSERFWALVALRCMQGLFNGNIGVTRSVMGELTDSTNIAEAVAMIPVVWSFTAFIGPALGGLLSHPTKSWPRFFGGVVFFHRYPYFLPCAVASSVSLISAVIAFIGLKETLPSAILREKRRKVTSHPTPDSTTSLFSSAPAPNYGLPTTTRPVAEVTPEDVNGCTDVAPPMASLLTSQVILILVAYSLLALVDTSYGALLPLLHSTSPRLGGLGFDPYRIGTIMGTWGTVNAFIQFFFLARTIKYFGPRKMFIISLSSYTILLSLYPLLGFLAKRSGGADALVWVVLCIQLLFALPNGAAFASIHIIVIESAPNSASLGALNGMAQAVATGTRAFGPSIASSLFSISLERHLAGGNMAYLILIGLALTVVRLGFLLPGMRKVVS